MDFSLNEEQQEFKARCRKFASEVIRPVRDLFGAVFFVSVGMMIDPSARVHATADLEPDVSVGPRSSIWYRAQVRTGSLLPGWLVAGGSDASMDSSLPTSTLACWQSGFCFSFSSRSRPGGLEITGGGTLSPLLVLLTSNSFGGESFRRMNE